MSTAVEIGDPSVELRRSRRDRLRHALLAVPDELTHAVRRLDRAAQQDLARDARVPLPVLLRARDVRAFIARVQSDSTLVALGDAIGEGALERVRGLLGASADDPSSEELAAALDLLALDVPVGVISVMLATAAVRQVRAAALCDALLAADGRFAVAEVEPAMCPVTSRRGDGPPVREPATDPTDAGRAEKKRRRAARRASARAGTTRFAGARRVRPERTRPGVASAAEPIVSFGEPPAEPLLPSRRLPPLTPAQAQRFSTDHHLVGRIVIAEIRFDGIDPADPGVVSKRRPCVVVGVSPRRLLVRAGYSAGGLKTRTWKSVELRDWEAAGLRCPTWIEADARVVHRAGDEPCVGRVTDEDWNSLF